MSKEPTAMEALLDEGMARHQAGDLAQARDRYRTVLSSNPSEPTALNMLGLVEAQTGDLDCALRFFSRAVEAAPDYPDALMNLARALRQKDRHAEAIPHLQAFLVLDADSVVAGMELGEAHLRNNAPEEARRHYEWVLQRAPDTIEAKRGLAQALAEMRENEAALELFEEILVALPDEPSSHANCGNVLRNLERLEEAAVRYRAALALDPGFANGHSNLAALQLWQGENNAALASAEAALRFDPSLHQAQSNKAKALIALGRTGEARATLLGLLATDPEHEVALAMLGSISQMERNAAQAIEYYERTLKIVPDAVWVISQLIHQRQRICAWDGLDDLIALVRKRVSDDPRAAVAPWGFLVMESTPAEQLQCARNWASNEVGPVGKLREKAGFVHHRRVRERIRVGYLSGDFHDHPMMYLMAEMLELHDRTKFEVFGYSYGENRMDDMRKRAQTACEHFVDISQLDHLAAAKRIYDDGIDILIDRKGYTANARNHIVALKPAPIQVNYLGYPGTMGADFIDYIVADRVLIPPSLAEHYAEQVVYMPDCYQANDTKRTIDPVTPSRAQCGLPVRGFVFCSFNQTYKITASVFDIWMRLLHAVPGSVLWLLDAGDNAKANLAREAQRRSINPERVILAPFLPLSKHLARNQLADLFLDTSPVNAHTTASDALWAGLPLITYPGESFVSRVAASLLTAIDLPELIANDLQDYEAKALRLATHPEELAAVREKLGRNRLTTPLFDSERYTRNLELAYSQMWDTFQAGEAPRHIEVQSK